MSQWLSIATAPDKTVILVADYNADTVATAYCRNGTWLLAPSTDELEFEPRWWLPANHNGNPFKAVVPKEAA